MELLPMLDLAPAAVRGASYLFALMLASIGGVILWILIAAIAPRRPR